MLLDPPEITKFKIVFYHDHSISKFTILCLGWGIQWLVNWQIYTYHPDSFGLSAETSGRISVRSEAYWTGILTLLSAYSSVSLWRLLTRFNSARGTLYLRERD